MTGDVADCDADTACGGSTKVPNAEHTACGKNTDNFLFDFSMSKIQMMVTLNLIVHRKFMTSCIVVCNAGHYKTGSSCDLCSGNKIKSMIGDVADCNADTACDGNTNVPNSGHTACGKPAVTF